MRLLCWIWTFEITLLSQFVPHLGHAPVHAIPQRRRDQPRKGKPHRKVPLHRQQQSDGRSRANVNVSATTVVNRVHGLMAFAEGLNDGLPFF